MGRPNTKAEPVMVRISKQLTQILRHSGRSDGLVFQADGFTPLANVLELNGMKKLKATEDMVREIVRTNDKQRFALSEDSSSGLLIRANQGHSMDGINMDELCGDPVHSLKPGEVCCHGTYERHFDSIVKHGLKAGGKQGQAFRRDVHFSVKHPGEEVLSGMRQNCQIAVYVDLPRAAADGIKFYRSSNHVILSEGTDGIVPPKYIESIWSIKSKAQIYPPPNAAALDEVVDSSHELCNLLLYRMFGYKHEL